MLTTIKETVTDNQTDSVVAQSPASTTWGGSAGAYNEQQSINQ